MDTWFVISMAAAAAGAACAVAALAAAWHVVPAREPTRGERAPRLIRALGPLARVAGHHVGPLLPQRERAATASRLRRAELANAVSSDDWLGARACYAALAAVTFALVATTMNTGIATAAVVGAVAGTAIPELVLRDAIARRDLAVQRELPAFLDVLTLAVESGCSLVAAIAMAVDKAPDGPLRRALQRFQAELRAGRSRADALRSLEQWLAMPAVTSLTGALLQAERTGARLGDVLRAQSTQRTNERFARAEKLAMQAPVKMLGPLILCIFPCTFLVLGFPIGMKLAEGL